MEDLNISGMSKNHKLAQHILDVGWHDFTTQLKYKLADRGHHLVKNDRFYASSKTCHCCGHKVDQLPLSIRKWHCPSCEAAHGRDENAAINLDNEGMIKLKAEGYTVSARGGFNVSQVSMNLQTSTKREAPFIALA
jgi:putative transposase